MTYPLSIRGGVTNRTFKSTYQILKELSQVWGELTDVSQANILEMVGGKRNANVVAALLENFTVAEKALATSAESAGSALAENEKYLDSIAGKVSKFKATFQELSVTLINSEFVKQIISFGTRLLSLLTAVAKLIDSIGGLNTVLMATAGILTAIKLNSITRLFTEILPAAFMKLAKPLTTVITVIGRVPAVFKSFNSGTALAIPGTSRFSAALKGLGISASTAQLAFGALTIAITAAIAIYQRHQQKIREQRDADIEAANSAATLSDEITDLTNKYLELSEAVKTDASAKDDLISTQDDLISKLDLEKGRIDELIQKYGNLTDAIKAASVESLQESERDLRGGLNASADNLISAADKATPSGSDSIIISGSIPNGFFSTSEDTRKKQKELYDGLKALEEAGFIGDGSYYTDDGSKYAQGFTFFAGLYDDLSTVDGVLSAYEELGNMLDVVNESIGSSNMLYEAVYKKYGILSESVKAYNTDIDALNSNLAQQYMLQGLIGKEVPNTKEEFDKYHRGVIDAAIASKKFSGTNQDTEDAVDSVLKGQAQFAAFYADKLVGAGKAAKYYKAQLTGLTEVMSKIQSAYSALEAAEKDMATGQGLTADTIAALAAAEENYLDFLYEENGVVKLNTALWKENANAKMQNEMREIAAEINSLKERNQSLEEDNLVLDKRVAIYEKLRALGNVLGIGKLWDKQLNDATGALEKNNDEIEENNELIQKNQGLLAIYDSLYSNITGDVSEYSNALNNFGNIANTIDSVAASYASLANLQNTVADGFTLSLEKILEYAKVYPQILDSATMTANGELALNEAVVNSFIAGKQAELSAQIDTQIAQLEADKATLVAKKELATAQLDLAKAAVNSESKMDSEFTAYKINLGNAMVEALIAMNADEVDAHKLATAAMAGNQEEFDEVARKCFENVDESSRKAAYDMAHAFFTNSENSTESIAEIAEQAHNTAKAIAGMADGVVAGSSQADFNGADGVYTGGFNFNDVDGAFDGVDYDYQSKKISLDDYIATIELDISDFEDAINQIDGQIATLQALKNTPFDKFQNLVSNASGIVGGRDAEEVVEEYIAAIDEYCDALKRLEEAQERRKSLEKKLEHTDDLSQKTFIAGDLLGAYATEAEAEKNLMAAKQATINANVGALRSLGFQVDYDSSTNKLFIRNLEHLNELTATSVGEYETLQEATNALRKETEELIDVTEQLNDDNTEASENIEDLGYQILETKKNIVSYIEDIYNKQAEAYREIIDLRKELIESAKDEYDYEADIAEKVKEVAELQSRIDQLALDDSRNASAERASLMQELAEKQKELADTQGDHAKDAQLDALDKMADDYEQQRADEIEIMRSTVTESEELWNAFYQTILGNNATVGTSVDEHIASAWIRAAQAVRDYSAAMSGIVPGGVVINPIPKYHTGGVVDKVNVGKDETLALLEKGEVVLNDGKQRTLYKIIDFQEELAKRLGTVIGSLVPSDITGSIRSLAGSAVNSITAGSQSLVFEPHIQVEINHSGAMNDIDAKSYGEKIADTAIDKLYSAFERRGISSTRTSRLKP